MTDLPAAIAASVASRLQQLHESGFNPPDAAFASELERVMAGSDFVAQALIRDPDVLRRLVESGDLCSSHDHARYVPALANVLEGTADETDLHARLRRFRRREMVRIAWRDLAGRASMVETITDLSALADACIDGALRYLQASLVPMWGEPRAADGTPMQMVVLGMGKLGAHELNFSSDVDLIFAYAEEGETQGGRRSVSHQEFFIRLGQRLIAALDAVTAEGFVFRVDMRLRPFGEASALALSFDAMEEYYQNQGREWERYALIKARPVAGDIDAGNALLTTLRPFIYRRYVDYGAFESLREMKALIEREVRRKGMEANVKLGPGGIREVEFIGQAFQLIRGGREPALQERSILRVLETLRERGALPDYVVAELAEAYTFLRNTEHRIQMWADEQKQELPESDDGRARLAFSMGFAGWSEFSTALRQRMAAVHEHFEQVFAAPQNEAAEQGGGDLAALWSGALIGAPAAAVLENLGYAQPDEVLRVLEQMRHGHTLKALSERGRQRLDRLLPLLIGAVTKRPRPDVTLPVLLRLIEAIARRSAYLALLVENPMALSQLVRLCAASPWIAELLTHHPVLLDELLDPRALYNPPRRATLEADLEQRLARVDPADEEQSLDALRQFKQVNTLRVAAADVMEAVPLMVVSDHLTEIAESVLARALDLAWRHLEARHGRPTTAGTGSGFAVIGYGKLGGIELGYGSDLDLVFLHSGDPAATTDGAKPVENAVFYARLTQRLIHVLSARTASGVLYEIDTRLPPSGASGLLVSSVDAFAEYQRREAWTWEHQALVRARVVAGDPAVAAAFETVRREVLGRVRELEPLREAVREMRQRMRSTLAKGGEAAFDLKQDAGGIADIEFLVQYGVLAWSHRFPDLLDYTDNIRQLERLANNGVFSPDDAAALADAYRAYRARVHRLTLQAQPALVDAGEFITQREVVRRIWERVLGAQAKS